jgi:hypothetical protein
VMVTQRDSVTFVACQRCDFGSFRILGIVGVLCDSVTARQLFVSYVILAF